MPTSPTVSVSTELTGRAHVLSCPIKLQKIKKPISYRMNTYHIKFIILNIFSFSHLDFMRIRNRTKIAHLLLPNPTRQTIFLKNLSFLHIIILSVTNSFRIMRSRWKIIISSSNNNNNKATSFSADHVAGVNGNNFAFTGLNIVPIGNHSDGADYGAEIVKSPPPKPLTIMDLSLAPMHESQLRVAYQGVPGAYSEAAIGKACPNCEAIPCDQFEVAFQAVELWITDRVALPVENSLGGSIHRN